MNILLDTHIAIWALNGDSRLSPKARTLLMDPDNTVYYSTVSVWEVMLKHSKRPQSVPFNERDFSEACQDAGYYPLNLCDKHILAVEGLSRPVSIENHNDPFDRLLLAQAKVENMAFLTHDSMICEYSERTVVPV